MANADEREDRVMQGIGGMMEFDPVNMATAVRRARSKFAKAAEDLAREFYVETGFVVTGFHYNYHIKREADEIVELVPLALNVDTAMPEDII